LRQIGCVLHISPNKNIILKAEKAPRIGNDVFDEALGKVGRVFDVFGPASSPYIAVRSILDNPDQLVGRVLYLSNKRIRRKKGRKRR